MSAVISFGRRDLIITLVALALLLWDFSAFGFFGLYVM
jgi:hypothetical protein